jgi:hypothetical protein
MSTHNNPDKETRSGKDPGRGPSEAVRQAFAALPFDQKVSTLIRVELDMLGDAVDTVVSAASRAADEIADSFKGRPAPSGGPGK